MPNEITHPFVSGKADGLDATLVRPSNWNAGHTSSGGARGDRFTRNPGATDGHSWLPGETALLTNRVGETHAVGDVVGLDPANDTSVVYADVASARRPYVVAAEATANLAQGIYWKSGVVTVKVTGAVTRGNYLRKSATNKVLEDTGVAQTVNPLPVGTLGVALQASAGPGVATITALFFGGTTDVEENLENLVWKSGTSFKGTLDHANTADRTYFYLDDDAHIQLQLTPKYIYWEEDYRRSFIDLTASGNADSEQGWSVTIVGSDTYNHTDTFPGVITTGLGTGSVHAVSSTLGGSTAYSVVQASKNPRIRIRWAQSGTGTITRRIGFGDSAFTADPTAGIYVRHINGGNIIAVCRAAGVETTLDTLVATADGVFHEVTFEVNGTTSVEVFVDGVSKGTISTNIPSAALAARNGSATGDGGYSIDYYHVRQER